MNEFKKKITTLAQAAGFIRARIFAPFNPHAYFLSGETEASGAFSLLLAALPYNAEEEDAPHGFAEIAPFACRNYYREAVKRLKKIAAELRRQHGGNKADYRIFCNSHLAEKQLAAACGLGVIGKNSLIITPEAGSQVIIAAMTLPFELSGDAPLEQSETGCACCPSGSSACALACPTGAVKAEGGIDLSRCIQWYASGNSGNVPAIVKENWGRRLYGCVECQKNCPHNQKEICGAKTLEGHIERFIEIDAILSWTDEEIKAKFKGTALGFSWLGAATLRRNALLAQAWEDV